MIKVYKNVQKYQKWIYIGLPGHMIMCNAFLYTNIYISGLLKTFNVVVSMDPLFTFKTYLKKLNFPNKIRY